MYLTSIKKDIYSEHLMGVTKCSRGIQWGIYPEHSTAIKAHSQSAKQCLTCTQMLSCSQDTLELLYLQHNELAPDHVQLSFDFTNM